MASNTNINDFIAQFKGGARSNRFRVQLSFPSYVTVPTTSSIFYCNSTDLPTLTTGITTVEYMGRKIAIPGDRPSIEWSVGVRLDRDFEVRKAFEQWQNGLMSFTDNARIPGDVKQGHWQDLTVQQLDVDGSTIIRTYTIHNAWPSDIGTVKLNWNDVDKVEEFDVKFQATHFTTNDIN